MKFLVALLFVSFLVGCASQYKTSHDFQEGFKFSELSTYALSPERGAAKNSPYFSDIDRARLEKAFRTEMARLGLREVKIEEADVLLAYAVLTDNRQDFRVNSLGVGFSRRHRYGGGVSFVDTKDYQQGTVIVDVIDSASNESVWRAVSTGRVRNDKNIEKRQRRIDRIVKGIFSKYSS